jgi:hypothetical protein
MKITIDLDPSEVEMYKNGFNISIQPRAPENFAQPWNASLSPVAPVAPVAPLPFQPFPTHSSSPPLPHSFGYELPSFRQPASPPVATPGPFPEWRLLLPLAPAYPPPPLVKEAGGAVGDTLMAACASQPERILSLTPDCGDAQIPELTTNTLDTSGALLSSVAAEYIISLVSPPPFLAEHERRSRYSGFYKFVSDILERDLFNSSVVVLGLYYARRIFVSSAAAEMSTRNFFLGSLMLANKVRLSFLLLLL